ncbi:hypothetical protein [Novosphingobium colocasiae]|uniref:DUF7064 domain-containing protein n=1 Tax=Novosphingobium colocasiae TaxID=1256513 RepID=UPI0035AEA9B6
MIIADDYKFHARDPEDRTWTETLFIIFSVPECAISGNIYVLTRPNMGVCHSSIEIHQGMCFHPWQLHHNDSQMHLPCPEDFSNFSLPNGLTFHARNERELEYRYDSLDGVCSLELSYAAVCDPTDTNDPAQVPQAGASKVDGYDGWNNGHLEGKGRVTGTLRLRDKTYAVDCIEGVNKSWGPRNDWGNKGASWVHVELGEGLGAFFVVGIEFAGREVTYGPFKYGYVLVNGERRPLVSAELTAKRSDMLVTSALARFEDDQGQVYEARGTTVAAGPWYNFNPSSAGYQCLMRWESGDRVGHAHIADFFGQYYLSLNMADELYA